MAFFDILDRLIDHAVITDVDAVAVRGVARLRIRTDVEADDDRAVDACQHDVVLGNRADAAVDRAHTNLGVGELFKRLLDRLDGTLHVGLDDDVEVLDLALL